ncbi:hyaluronidase-1-like [Amphiura filiformis]|uniref:hyaluronidase-1-like n=1 Tax=Amphiura filiformis TaxID=82378 RepID=UPI003B20B6FF
MKEVNNISVIFTIILMSSSSNACYNSAASMGTGTDEGLYDPPKQSEHNQGSSAFDSQIFKTVWNLPRNKCESHFGVDLNLTSYGIEANAVNTKWNGHAVTIFYNDDLGLYPAYEANGKGEIVKKNAGLPQLTNLTQHLEKVAIDIIAAIPDPDFTGLAVIDWEKWFPQWDFPGSIMDLYRGPSIRLVHERHPDWDDTTVELVAKLEYEQSAKALMEGTLLLGKRLRRKGQWGFYHHPYCYNKHGSAKGCKPEVQQLNNYIPWLFRQTTAYYPSIYINDNVANVSDFVQARFEEALRIREDFGDVKKQDMFSYCRFNYSHTSLHYNLKTLNDTILKSAESGLSGVVLWGDYNDTDSREACQQLKQYVRDALGPTITITSMAATNCSLRLCSGHGRCSGKILQCNKARKQHVSTMFSESQQDSVVRRNRRKQLMNMFQKSVDAINETSDYHKAFNDVEEECSCMCFSGWSGDGCDMPSENES